MNRLARESSPYLQQHASNPVDWYAWNDESLRAARERNVPIFLSIGYSACHWCHVMEHESFDDHSIAALMNAHFVNIKVDREERPDLDQIYMSSVMAMTGHGGWPMSVFMTPDLKPFYCGTYWPPDARRGMPGFRQILLKVHEAWVQRRHDIVESAEELSAAVETMCQPRGEAGSPDDQLLHHAMRDLLRAGDAVYGGFGDAPKFPHPMDLRVLLRTWRRFSNSDALRHARLSGDRMAAGGVYDHLGGGFHRYSTDANWLAPHFEKMLYDNGLLTSFYAELFQVTQQPEYARVLHESLNYILREMTIDGGAFASTQDADSEGEEGRFFVWSQREIVEVLGADDAKLFCAAYDVSASGNWEHKNIINRPRPLRDVAGEFGMAREDLVERLAPMKRRLFAVRDGRVHPGTDDKIITAWNGMMMAGMSLASRVLKDSRYAEAASAAADFLLRSLRNEDGRLFHTARQGRATISAFLDDYACLIDGLVELHQSTLDEARIDQAVELAERMLSDFSNPAGGAMFYTAADQPTPITRVRDSQDGATPSGNAMAATALLKLAVLTGREEFRERAGQILTALDGQLRRAPMSGGQAIIAIDHFLSPMTEVVIVSNETEPAKSAMLTAVNERFLPGTVIAWRSTRPNSTRPAGSAKLDALFHGRTLASGQTETAWVCSRGTCQPPVSSSRELLEVLDRLVPLPPVV